MVRFVSDLRGGNKNRNGDSLAAEILLTLRSKNEYSSGEDSAMGKPGDSYRNPGMEENEKEKRGGEEPMISPPVSRRAHAWHDAHIRICGEHVGRGRGDRSGQDDVERSEVRVKRG